MFATDDTIVALATPPGPGGIGVVRLSGARARSIAGAMLDGGPPLEPRRASLRRVADAAAGGRPIDRVVATYFPRPGSYTGEDVVELSGHGSPVLLRQIVSLAMDGGARLAQPGEFTLRAFLNGRLDLVQAEAVGDLVAAATPLQARVAFE
ncbi:MAG: tRNA uridine-5-carboxymethylaminomethyl(34) synthesis GTPase MnmE, partial [Acidobacteria bacterium]|nr:tRNA uridine-5-carboxymethylaminomethyl(34) synthesis GTPase MnmE [Acidobacteriota bacterium]